MNTGWDTHPEKKKGGLLASHCKSCFRIMKPGRDSGLAFSFQTYNLPWEFSVRGRLWRWKGHLGCAQTTVGTQPVLSSKDSTHSCSMVIIRFAFRPLLGNVLANVENLVFGQSVPISIIFLQSWRQNSGTHMEKAEKPPFLLPLHSVYPLSTHYRTTAARTMVLFIALELSKVNYPTQGCHENS